VPERLKWSQAEKLAGEGVVPVSRVPWWPFVPCSWDGWGRQNTGLDLMLQGTLCLLCSSGAENALQPLVHLTHLVGGGCGQRVQKCGHHGHVLAGLGEGGELLHRSFHCHGLICLKHQFALAQVDQLGLNSHPFIGELASSLCGFSFDVILRGASSFLLAGYRWLREGCWCGGPLQPRW
jgi:hypothetical protein